MKAKDIKLILIGPTSGNTNKWYHPTTPNMEELQPRVEPSKRATVPAN
jgi:hypothetical protein